MNYLSLLEIFVVSSATIQMVAVLLAFYIYFERDKPIWIWAIIALSISLIRRIIAMFRYSTGGNIALETEYALTIALSICWIIFLLRIIYKDKIKKK